MGLEINGKRGGEEERDKKGKRRGHTMTLTNCGDLVWVIVGLRHPTGSRKYRKMSIVLMEVFQTCTFGF